MVQKLVDGDYNAYPEKYEAAAGTYLSLSVEQREIADEFYERGYSGHPLHLIADNTRNTSEKDVVNSNRENHGALTIYQRHQVRRSGQLHLEVVLCRRENFGNNI